MAPIPVLMSWSGGKDCALALESLRGSPLFEVVELVTSLCPDTHRIAIHEVRRDLLRRQADSLGLPLAEVVLPRKATNAEYERAWADFFRRRQQAGIDHVAFGDLFLDEIRTYRQSFLGRLGMQALFPIWGNPTIQLAQDAINRGLKAIVCSCDRERLGGRFAGRLFDRTLLEELPEGCDPCGENGEFHTFVFDGPGFRWPVPWKSGKIAVCGPVEYVDLLTP